MKLLLPRQQYIQYFDFSVVVVKSFKIHPLTQKCTPCYDILSWKRSSFMQTTENKSPMAKLPILLWDWYINMTKQWFCWSKCLG